jgi:acyl-CoA hydrolase
MFTAQVTKIEFLKAVPGNSIVEVVGRIKEAGPVRLMVEVTVYSEGLYDPDQQVAAKASFTMTALNEKNQVVRLAVPAVG